MVTKSETKRAWIHINDVVREVLALTQSELHKHQIRVFTELFQGRGSVYGDRVQLLQVLLNLIVNGVEAMCAAQGRRDLTILSRSSSDGEVHISVVDTGLGVEDASMDRVFDSFFTTKAAGMGMGLSICRSIIAAHGGRIWVEPNIPRGAIFHFTLPTDTPPKLA
jgi:signal transduction histidine kinase